MNISNKIVFITGGSTGIGLAIAKEIATRPNNTICIFARNQTRLLEAKVLLSNAKCHIFSTDTKDYNALKKVLDEAVKLVGAPDLLINCVGRAYPDHFENISPEMMNDTMQSNFNSMWNPTHILVSAMKEKGGKIVNTSSVGGYVGVFGYTDYSASKFAIIGFSEALQQEVKKYNIDVQVLCPPDTETPGYETENKTKPEETKEISKSAKLMKPEVVAKEAVKGIEGNKFFIIPGFDGKLTWWMKRHFPFIVNGIMHGAIKKVQRKN